MDTMVDVSVIMLTYNRENLVPRAIESVLAQTYEEFEFIIIDNGSSDSSGEIAEGYAEKDSRVKVVHIPKSTIGRGRNLGLEQAKGSYITFIDDDDTADVDMVSVLHAAGVECGADVIFCGSRKEVEGHFLPNCVFEGTKIFTPSEAVIALLKRKWLNAAMPTKMIKRELFQKIKFKEEGKYDDISVVYKYFANADKVVGVGEEKYCFYRHPGNNSAFTANDMLIRPEQLDEYFAAFKERTEYLSVLLPDIADYAQYSEWSYMISMCNKIISANKTDCSMQLNFIKSELYKYRNEFYNSPYIEEFEKKYMEKYIL